VILPLDAHAHIEPDIAPAELAALRSCVIAVTRTLDEYAQTRDRPDRCVVWGAGCHPGLAREVKGFSASRLRDAIATTPCAQSWKWPRTPPGFCLSTATGPPASS
jgi:TatD DNase family protein